MNWHDNDTAVLVDAWQIAKQREAQAVADRRAIEDVLTARFEIAEDKEGSTSHKIGDWKLTVDCRMTRKVDADLVQEIAAEHGLTDQLGQLFRWKPEINAKAWQGADPAITTPLLGAITTKPGRPTYKLTKLTKED
jgi:hypothetical protein